MGGLLRRWIGLVSAVGADAADPAQLRLRKALLVSVALLVLPAGLLWGALYWIAGEPGAALLPWAYVAGSVVSLVAFQVTRSFALFRGAELLLILVVPFVLAVALGGFTPSSGVVLWSVLAPLGAIAFDGPRRAWPWFAAYLILVAISEPLAGLVRPAGGSLSGAFVVAFQALNIGAVSIVAFILLVAFARQREDAQEKADGLLLNILPPEIAELLKADSRQIAEQFDEASVLFADVVDFTPLSARMSAHDVVGLLDRLFTDFDELTDRYRLEKIKTIGDAYMVASGVPRRRADHATVLATMALEMLELATRHQRDDGAAIELRIGLNSGPVVAGVIGRRKFIYDLWGDVVNTASRMESHGTAGQIQIAEGAYELLKDDFVCDLRGYVEVKGKGAIETWYLRGPKPA
jgi:adenylate cyclase